MPYLAVRSGTYFLRLAVPRSLQPLLGHAEIFQSLNTSSREQARVMALSLTAELLLSFSRMKASMKNKNREPGDDIVDIGIIGADGIPRVSNRRQPAPEINATKFEGKANLRTGEISVKVDPNIPGDLELAEAWQANIVAKNPAAFGGAAPPATPQPSVAADIVRETKDEIASTLEKIAGIKPRNIHSAFTEYVKEIGNIKPRSLSQYKSHVKHFVDWIAKQHTNISVHKISKDHMLDYRDLLRVSKSHKAPFQIFHPHNVYKRMVVVEGFFKFCQSREWIADGEKKLPTYDLKGPKPDYEDSETSYVMFSQTELEKIFSVENYKPNYEAPHMFWGPLLGLFTGARRGEIVSIHPDNITNTTNSSKTWTMAFLVNVKNKNSRRTIPLHRTLIELGFLDYLEDMRQIFPDAKSVFPYTWNMNKIFGEFFAAYCDRVGVISPTKVFHSFRKNVSNVLLNAGVVDYKYQEHYIGHLKYTLHQNIYSGREYPMKFYSDLVSTHLKYDLDLSAFKYQRGMFNDFLLDEKRKQDRKKKFPKKTSRKGGGIDVSSS